MIDLNERLAYWQKRLRLQDWDITARWARYFELRTEEAERGARVTMLLTKKVAAIEVLDPQDADPGWACQANPERELIHELLHLHLLDFEPEDEDGLAFQQMERAIHTISCALYDLERENEGEPSSLP